MKLIFRSVKDELTRLINKARAEGKTVERVEMGREEFYALLIEFELDNVYPVTKTARETGEAVYMDTWIVNVDHESKQGEWSLFMSINTDDDAALQFEGNQYCMYLPNLNRQFKGNLDYLRKTVNKMAVPKGGKYETRLRTHLQDLRAAIESGEPFHVRESGNQDIEITLEKVEKA